MNHRIRLTIRILPVCIALSAPLPACQPVPTPPPTATPAYTATPWASRTPTPTATATITPTGTLSPTPTDLPEPLTVGVSLREAEREVLSWFDPTRAPRIEWSRYVRRSELAEAIPPERFGILLDQWPQGFEERNLDALGDPLILILASTRGIDPMSGPSADGRPRLPVPAPPDAISPERLFVVAVFDGNTGERLIAQPISAAPGRTLSALQAIRSADIDVRAAARRTLTPTPPRKPEPAHADRTQTPTPTLVPSGARLTWANLPAALRPTFRAYPLAPGSSWTWRYTSSNGDVRWVAEIITETIESAWLEGETAVVRSRIDKQSLTPKRNQGDAEQGDTPTTALRFVTPRLISGARWDKSVADRIVDDLAPATSGEESPFNQGGVARELFIDLLPSGSNGLTFVGDEPATVTTRAGTFHDCWMLTSVGGASWGAVRWFCPGVGPVQYGFGSGTPYHSSTAVADLIRWRRATLPER
jgi:hypothetical protein